MEYERGDMVQVQLLDCDSIDQAKEKILKSIYKVIFMARTPGFVESHSYISFCFYGKGVLIMSVYGIGFCSI